jgi:hypothetical protein
MFPNWQYIKIDKNRHSKSTHFKVRTSLYMSLLIAQLAAPMVDLNKKLTVMARTVAISTWRFMDVPSAMHEGFLFSNSIMCL